MDPTIAIRILNELLAEVDSNSALLNADEPVTSWKARVRAVLTRSLGGTNHIIQEFDGVWFSPGIYYDGQPDSDFIEARASGIRSARALIEAAVFELGLLEPAPPRTPTVSSSGDNYDAGLWAHVRGLVEREDWAHLAAAVATYVEDRVRTWSGLPANVVGHGLYANALGPGGALPLGGTGTTGEAEGWKYLGMGLAQAVGNADRHRITSRSDLRRYALGVLGLGSLVLTQLRWEHPQEISNIEDR